MQDEVLSSGVIPTTILIVGLGTEGESNYTYLTQRFPEAQCILSDAKAPEELAAVWQTWLEEPHTHYVPLAELAAQHLDYTATILSKTPGIPVEHPALQHLLNSGVHLTSNTACFFEEITTFTGTQTIVVTGSKGKSTTSSLITHVLQSGERPVFFAGNIGTPPLGVLDGVRIAEIEGKQPIVVLELSSHQLRESKVHPNLAVLLDITPEHLDYYPSFTAYWQAKASVTAQQTPADYLLFNPTHPIPTRIALSSHAAKVHIGAASMLVDESGAEHSADAWFDAENFYAGEWKISRSVSTLRGDHNAFNSLPAIWIAQHFSLTQEQVIQQLQSFESLPHRLQPVGTVHGVEYINDSQATTPEAAIAALRSFASKPITLLAGGSDKGVSFDELARAILAADVRQIVLFPPMGEKIKQAVESLVGADTLPQMTAVESMSAAVQHAAAVTPEGGVVLLSPACASFGLFANYQDRGNQFVAAVEALATTADQ